MPQVISGNELDFHPNDDHKDFDSDSDFDSERDSQELPPDFPPESFWLSGEAELDWFDRNALFERKDSTKGSVLSNYSGNLNTNSEPSSQRFSRNHLNSRASIIGLPRIQKPNRRACKPVTTRLFNKRSGSGNEPGSPKVSCMGRVRSKRDRSRRSRNRKLRSSEAEPESPKRAGLFGTIRAMFRGSRWAREAHAPAREVDGHDIMNRLPASEVHALVRGRVAGSEPPGLGGLARFASGRRSGSWG